MNLVAMSVHLFALQRPLGARLALTAAAAASLAACGQGGAQGGPGGGMPPAQVGVVTVQPAGVTIAAELPGRLEAWRTAQVRARITGVVKKRMFDEGSVVKAGQSLFQVDDAPYRAALASAEATQAKADAALAQAQALLERNRPLADARAISQQDWVATQAAHKQAQADLAASKAAVVQAKLNLDYAAVQAPITGRIGRALVTEGALVSQAEATLLATIQQTDKLYVNITQPATEALRLKRAFESGKLQTAEGAKARLVLDDGSEYALPAKLLFADLTVDPTSGQVTLRAEVPNPKGELLPGLYVKVRVDQAKTSGAMLLPQQAVTRGAAGDSVMVVGADHQVAPRPVQLGGTQGSQWVVLGGLKAGEQVVVDGFQKIRPKAAVQPVPWSASGAAPAATGGTSASGPAPAASGPAPASAASR
ncbi:efflux RND transporter periplasmic adaptor subunit [Ideonella sp.]|uniref:efflux RND transporter periplasmic adaptor subunit n=1 Tax=Ideonella sp. TaxID=1929293 RepID=UPI002B4776F2|nr:efflux RND transporter periplasmic adaptor subunit [Ideonella sp.]HJV71005.1 efflux RND transporter periplasmic adaptor subunit [Ideonella sp.]